MKIIKHWNIKQRKSIENRRIDAFLVDIIEVYRKHNLAISHEDIHGGFDIVELEDSFVKWLEAAADNT